MHHLLPDWPAPSFVKSLFTLRGGGVSQPPFDSLNLGDHVGDAPQAVQANRHRLHMQVQRLSPGAGRAVFLQQVHGNAVAQLQPDTPDATVADAALATAPGVICTIMVADCLPVLLAHRRLPLVAAAHAGWRGLAGVQGQGVLESTWAAWQQAASALEPAGAGDQAALAADTLVWLGPCIGPQAFEVGEAVHQAFADAPVCFQPIVGQSGKWLADLPGLARQRLHAMGLRHIHGNDGSPSWCTHSNPQWYFSHRRDAVTKGGSGRMAACIWLEDSFASPALAG